MKNTNDDSLEIELGIESTKKDWRIAVSNCFRRMIQNVGTVLIPGGCIMTLYHFTGIKGSGMSSLAQILHDSSYAVQGSDVKKYFSTSEPCTA